MFNSGLNVHDHGLLELNWFTIQPSLLVSFNQSSNRATPLPSPGYPDTPKWVTAEKDHVTRISSRLSVVNPILTMY